MNFFAVDKKFNVNIILKYLETEKDAERLDNGDWKLYVDEPWQMYKELPCKDMEQAIQRFLFNYGKLDHIDMSILIEYCYDDKVVGSDCIESLPSVNLIAEQLAETKYKYHSSDVEMLKNAYSQFDGILNLDKDKQEQIVQFINIYRKEAV